MARAKVATARWSRAPTSWIRSEGLKAFRGGRHQGVSIAALKLLFAIMLHAENNADDEVGPDQGSVALSYDALSGLTNLSREMIAHGVRFLEKAGVVTVVRGGRTSPNRYRLADYEAGKPWSKIPNRRWFRHAASDRIATLHDLSCRRECDLNALRLYLLFCAFANNRTHVAMIGYEKIEDYTGIASGKIRPAISVLVEHGLIAVDRDKDPDDKLNHPNKYTVLGL
ncbi:hypothetical protein BH10PSE13_BH10PSE13_10060 [soil metagenome]